MLTRLSRWVDGIKKIHHDTRVVLCDDDCTTIDVYHATGLRHIGEGALPFDLANIKDCLRFHVATSRGRLEDERTTLDAVNTFVKCLFAGFARVAGKLINAEAKRAEFDVSTF